jgi:hypothetical protein
LDLDDILYGGYDIEEDVDSILFNPVASTISKWWTFKHLWWVHLFNRAVDLDEMLYGDDIEDYLDYMLFNSVASTIAKWLTFTLVRRVQLLN